MNPKSRGTGLAVVACALILGVTDASAFRMIQNTSTGRTWVGTRVTCTDPGGFVHWTTPSIAWRLNPSNQGGKPGVSGALQHALDSWTNVTPAAYVLSLAGNTSAGFSLDGINTVSWGSDGACTGGCLALTALVLAPGQVITEADILFNDAFNWNTDGSDYDTEAIAAHELGHGLGIHHTEITKPKNRPTMYASYFGTAGRSLESDDWGALNCSCNRYPPLGSLAALTEISRDASGSGVMDLAARPRSGGAIIRFTLKSDEHVKLELFDVAGRKLTTLMNELKESGQYEVAWDGSTNAGHVRSGVYFARIVTSAGSASATVLLTN